MTSVLKSFAQIPYEVKGLRALSGATAFEVNVGVSLKSQMMTVDDFDAVTTSGVDISGKLLKDLGRFVITYDADTSAYIAKYRAVQVVDGPDSEGVPEDYATALYVKVWSADGAGVRVVRTGPLA